MRFASALSQATDLDTALGEIVRSLRADLLREDPDLVLVFAGPPHDQDVAALGEGLGARFPRARIAGCSAHSVIADGRELEGEPGLAVAAGVFPEAAVTSFGLDPEALPLGPPDASAWCERLGLEAGTLPQLLLLAHPVTPHLEEAIASLDRSLPGSVIVGGIASAAGDPRNAWILEGTRPRGAGIAGFALRGGVRLTSLVAQGCRPVGQPSFVTRAEGRAIYELDGKPPFETLNRIFSEADAREKRLLQSALFLGVGMRASESRYGHGDFLIRNVLGVHAESGALVIAGEVREHQVVQFHVRDGAAASADLRGRIARYAERGAQPEGALLFSCLGRGRGLYGVENHDTDTFAGFFPDTPIAGFFCNGEIGPVEGQTFLHGYTSAFALFVGEDA